MVLARPSRSDSLAAQSSIVWYVFLHPRPSLVKLVSTALLVLYDGLVLTDWRVQANEWLLGKLRYLVPMLPYTLSWKHGFGIMNSVSICMCRNDRLPLVVQKWKHTVNTRHIFLVEERRHTRPSQGTRWCWALAKGGDGRKPPILQ